MSRADGARWRVGLGVGDAYLGHVGALTAYPKADEAHRVLVTYDRLLPVLKLPVHFQPKPVMTGVRQLWRPPVR
jgi:hypothetical protein